MRARSGRELAIVEATLDLAEEHGVAGITTAALAHKLEFTEAALYRYYTGKDAIIAAATHSLAERVLATMLLELVPTDAAGHEPTTQLHRHITRFSYRSGVLIELLLYGAGGRDNQLRQAGSAFIEEYDQRMTEYFHQLQLAGLLAQSAHLEELSRLWICQLLGGFVRSRFTQESWEPTEQPGFHAFVGHLRTLS